MIAYSVERPIAVLTLQHSPVNAFEVELGGELLRALERASSGPRYGEMVCGTLTGGCATMADDRAQCFAPETILDFVEADISRSEANARKLTDKGTRDPMENSVARMANAQARLRG